MVNRRDSFTVIANNAHASVSHSPVVEGATLETVTDGHVVEVDLLEGIEDCRAVTVDAVDLFLIRAKVSACVIRLSGVDILLSLASATYK